MRTLGIIMVMFLGAGCSVVGEGMQCGGAFTTCESGFVCGEGDTCISCGAPGERCCVDYLEAPCDNGVCVNPGGVPATCEGNCGKIGLPVCSGDYCETGTPSNGECIEGEVGSECADPNGEQHKVWVIGPYCGDPTVHNFWTKTPGQADACRQLLIDNLLAEGIDAEVCPLDGAYEDTHACGQSKEPELEPNSQTFFYCSDSWLQHCKEMSCKNCDWTETPDACP